MASLRFSPDRSVADGPAQPSAESSASWLPKSLIATAVVAAVLFFAFAVAAIFLSRRTGNIAMLWYANAAIVVLLQGKPQKQWPTLLGAAALGNIAANGMFGDPWLLTLSFTAGNVFEILIGALLLRR